MTPDSSEGRERLARMEVRVDANERQIAMLGALPLQVGVIQERLDSLRADLHQAERERDERFARHERKVDDALEKLAQSFSNQITACSNEVAKVAQAQQKWQEAEQQRRELERKERDEAQRDSDATREQSRTQRLVARYGLVTALVVVLISSITSIVVVLLGGAG